MLYTYRVTAGQEAIVSDLLVKKIEKVQVPIKAIIVSPRLRGYVLVEAPDDITAKSIITNVPHIKGALQKPMKIGDIGELLESKPQEIKLDKGDLVEIIAGAFKGEKAKVVRLEGDNATVELVEVAVPIPVTIKVNTLKVLK